MIFAILSHKLFPKKPAVKPETAVFLSKKPETAGFPKSEDCPQPNQTVLSVFMRGKQSSKWKGLIIRVEQVRIVD